MKKESTLPQTGERLLTNVENATAIHHLHRYAIALDLVPGKSVLDIASGEGYGSHLLSTQANRVIGVDIDKQAVNHANMKYKSANLTFVEGAANKIPLEDHTVDVVVSFETIEHHEDHDGMLMEIKRVLKKGGVLLISSPDKKNYSRSIGKKNPFHLKELFKEEFSALVANYFEQHKLYDQHNGFHSLISPSEGKGSGYKEYQGNFEKITQQRGQMTPVYNICIASDDASKCHLDAETSTFDGNAVLKQLDERANEVKNSLTYRIGYFISCPFRWLK